MYGIVNKAMEELVITKFGEQKWERIKQASGIDIDFFVSNEPYDDAITYKLALAASNELQLPVSKILEVFGNWWVVHTSKEKYGGLMNAGGKTFQEFMLNLPAFHNRIMLIYPKLTPPEFRVNNINENSVNVHYYSKREGLKDFVVGLFHGLAEIYDIEIEVELLNSRDSGHDHEIFCIKW